jgi:hypothetical protein
VDDDQEHPWIIEPRTGNAMFIKCPISNHDPSLRALRDGAVTLLGGWTAEELGK